MSVTNFDVSINFGNNQIAKKEGSKVYLPSRCDYKIKVENLNPVLYFTIESCFIGERPVLGVRNIFFHESASIKGFQCDSKESFLFIANPSSTKENSTITLKLQKYRVVNTSIHLMLRIQQIPLKRLENKKKLALC
jgi:hypothetical protein